MNINILSLENLRSKKVSVINDLSLISNTVFKREPGSGPTLSKKIHKSEIADVGYKGHFLSLIEGSEPSIRVSSSNPPSFSYGFILDFDNRHNLKLFGYEDMEFKPNIVTTSFSGGKHALYFFNDKIPICDNYIKLIKQIVTNIRIEDHLLGLDKKALSNLSSYYENGEDLELVSEEMLDTSVYYRLMHKRLISKKVKVKGEDISWKRIETLVERNYPGRWTSGFSEGSRGLAFWDPDAQDNSAVVMHDWGCYRFSGSSESCGSWPWKRIFGEDVFKDSKDEEEKVVMKSVLSEYYYCGRYYYCKNPIKGDWDQMNLSTFKDDMVVKGYIVNNYDINLPKLKRLVETTNKAHYAIPIVHCKKDLIDIGNYTFLNTSHIRCLQPRDSQVPFYEDSSCPINILLKRLFCDEFREIFMDVSSSYYYNIYNGLSSKSPILIISGKVGTGKTFLSTGVLGSISGGHADALNYFSGRSRFTSEMTRHSLWSLDDVSGNCRYVAKSMYSQMIKAFAANPTITYEEKGEKATEIPFNGLLSITTNDDPISLSSAIPDLDINIMDKIVAISTREDCPALDKTDIPYIQKRLPELCSGLLKWYERRVDSGHLNPDNRYKIKPYMDPVIYERVLSCHPSSQVLNVVNKWKNSHFKNCGDDYYEGDAFTIMNEIKNDDSLGKMLSNDNLHTLDRFQRYLSSISKVKGSKIDSRVENMRHIFKIYREEPIQKNITGFLDVTDLN